MRISRLVGFLPPSPFNHPGTIQGILYLCKGLDLLNLSALALPWREVEGTSGAVPSRSEGLMEGFTGLTASSWEKGVFDPELLSLARTCRDLGYCVREWREELVSLGRESVFLALNCMR